MKWRLREREETPIRKVTSHEVRETMSNRNEAKSGSEFPWGALLATAAVGATAYFIAKRVQDARHHVARPVEEALRACDRAAELLDNRISFRVAS